MPLPSASAESPASIRKRVLAATSCGGLRFGLMRASFLPPFANR